MRARGEDPRLRMHDFTVNVFTVTKRTSLRPGSEYFANKSALTPTNFKM
jgi:hypothetical protein